MFDELTAIVDGYNSYFSFSKVKSGYSGPTFCNLCFVGYIILPYVNYDTVVWSAFQLTIRL